MWMRGCPLPTVAADCWASISEWAGILYTWQPLTWDWYHVNERVSSTHSRPLLGGWYRVNKRAVSSKPASRWWGAGIVWMREEPSDCALHVAERRSEKGAACLDSGFFRAASVATWESLAPVSALGFPLRHGRGMWEAGLMSCPRGSMGERNADI